MIVVIMGVVVLLLAGVFLTYMARVAIRPKVHTLEYERNRLLNLDYMQGESIAIENEHYVTSFDGYKLWTGYVPGNPDCEHYVVLSHGYTSCRYGMYKYAAIWRRLGYHCILFENRGHGVNPAADCSFGIWESRDLIAVIEDTYNRYGRDIHLGLHGESMGAGLQLMALKYNPKVDFIVNDCGYSEILPVLRWKVQDSFHFPAVLANLASPFAKLFHGYRFEDVCPIEQLKENEIPICFVHGVADNFTHKWHSENMYKVNKGYKELHLYEGADHAECVVVDTLRYQRMLEDFMKKIYKGALEE